MQHRQAGAPDLAYLDEVKRKREEKALREQRKAELGESKKAATTSGESIAKELIRQHAKDRTNVSKVETVNPPDMDKVVESINKLNLTAFTANQNSYVEMVKNMSALALELETLSENIKNNSSTLDKTLDGSIRQIQQVAKELSKVKMPELDIRAGLADIVRAVEAIEVNPEVSVAAPVVNVPAMGSKTVELDMSPLLEAINGLQETVAKNKVEIPKQDFDGLESAVRDVKNAINNQRFPVPNYILPFKDINGKAVQAQLDASGNVPTTGGGTQYTEGDIDSTPTGTVPMWRDNADDHMVGVSDVSPLPIVDSAANTTLTSINNNVDTTAVLSASIDANTAAIAASLADPATEATLSAINAKLAGTNNIGQVSVAPQTANGLSVFNATSSDGATALTSTAQAIKASAGQLYGWYIYNPNATAQFVQLYNTAAASVTVGTTNPLFMLTIPATSGANVEFTNGITFSNAGWSCAATATAGGNGAPATALDAVFFYK